MKCQILFSGKNMKNISKCHLLKILPRVLSIKELSWPSTCIVYLLFSFLPLKVPSRFATGNILKRKNISYALF